MLSLKLSVLPLLLFLAPALAVKSAEHAGPISGCIWNCFSTYALHEKIFTCGTIKRNTDLVHCIRKCPIRDIDNFSHLVLGLPQNCEAQLYPGATGSITDSPPRPTGSSKDHGTKGWDDCPRVKDDSRNSTRHTRWTGSCTVNTMTGTDEVNVPTPTESNTGNVTRTETTAVTSTTAGAAVFGTIPSVGFLAMGVAAWALVL